MHFGLLFWSSRGVRRRGGKSHRVFKGRLAATFAAGCQGLRGDRLVDLKEPALQRARAFNFEQAIVEWAAELKLYGLPTHVRFFNNGMNEGSQSAYEY